uniref:Uncharacterized protein n=1 Tax=Cacopsylla melanoneura TaxID=428564 RepID=A0A8D8PQ90_9HEMI
MLVKHDQPSNGFDNVCLLVHNNDGSGSQTGLSGHQTVKVHENVLAYTLWNQRGTGSSWNNGQQIIPAPNHISRMSLNQLLEWNAHFFLHSARSVHVARDVEQFSA